MTDMNPFKFGTIVDEPFFTDRVQEQDQIRKILASDTHLIIISPRRFGKTSLVKKVVTTSNRPVIFLDLQIVTDVHDFAAQLLKRVNRLYPFERFKTLLKSFRLYPTVAYHPHTTEVEISFLQPGDDRVLLEDAFNLLNTLGEGKEKPIVVLDEFQDIQRIGKGLDRQLRAILQHHSKVNYIFMGSAESMMREIFERKNSPFYHFGFLMPLGKISIQDFRDFVKAGFLGRTRDPEALSQNILSKTKGHPYYTQQLAYTLWNMYDWIEDSENSILQAIEHLIQVHDLDYQRLWNNQNQTDKKLLVDISQGHVGLLSHQSLQKMGNLPSSTLYSGLKRLTSQGIIYKENEGYQLDDPFFQHWILKRRNE